ncbi:MAG: DUF2085 domain-containing protein [Methanomassiliicoccus sp.]|nr:DUF2085 domain-containing protein [Methanomassiliicoccus sp.]
MKRDPMFRAKRAALMLFAVWLVLVFLAPFTLPAGSVTDLSGRANAIDNYDQVEKMNPLAAGVYLFGDINCHQLAERSFYLHGNQMPFCARDVGIFIGLVVGMLVALVFSPRFSWPVLAVLILPILMDGGVQLTGVYESNNLLRLATGALGGIGASYFLGHFSDWLQSGGLNKR